MKLKDRLKLLIDDELFENCNDLESIANDDKEETEFIVFRFVPTGSDQSDKIKNDKVDCEKLVAEILKEK